MATEIDVADQEGIEVGIEIDVADLVGIEVGIEIDVAAEVIRASGSAWWPRWRRGRVEVAERSCGGGGEVA